MAAQLWIDRVGKYPLFLTQLERAGLLPRATQPFQNLTIAMVKARGSALALTIAVCEPALHKYVICVATDNRDLTCIFQLTYRLDDAQLYILHVRHSKGTHEFDIFLQHRGNTI